jgi:protease I
MKALILAADDFEDLELMYPYYRLQEAGIDVDVAASRAGTVTGKHGYAVKTTRVFSELDAAQYDLLVVPGGRAPEAVRLHARAVAVAKAMFEAGKLVAAICHGAQVLISAGVLNGKNATCWKGIRDDLKAAGGSYSDRPVVVDGNLITSRCPDDLPAFCREIFKALPHQPVA